MQPFTRRRQTPALHAASFMSSRPAGSAEVLPKPPFQLDLWLGFTLHSWILDVGRPLVTLVLPADLFPLNRPAAAEYLHLLYNICTPLVLLKMLERSPRSLPPLAIHLGMITVAMGTSLHLATDAITRRLVLIGYQLHLSVRDNPIMKELRPPALIDAFEVLCFFDDTLGHLMWCFPFFLVIFLFFSGCFCHRTQEDKMPLAAWMLLIPSAAYYWFLIAEGQTFILFIFTFFAMTATVMHQRRRGLVPDANGLFMLYSFSAALLLLAFWVSCLWSDDVLRRKHPGLIYIPQPRAVYTLHTAHTQHTHT
ncbi:ceroid-lipofuscinosis neuronal protein 6 homolog [Eleginops maclovinus]|uniref:ceroid-lipofuscinosis neuronal protein 6 homolog n=1 Tax=Eleginops maclovinus TaxID=56733 RepID=UPI003080CB34